jgi:peptidoglycan/LPS O-acetylase OafA/YrhL
MIDAVAVGEARPGYELWHPNREKADVITTKFVITFLMLATAAICALIAVSGWTLLSGGASMGITCLIYAGLYALFGFRAMQWSRGVLPVSAALSLILAIFCGVAANSWFARDKDGFEDALLPVPIIGLLVLILLALQIILAAAAFYGFSQEWHVEEERPIGSGEDYGAGAPPENGAPQPA